MAKKCPTKSKSESTSVFKKIHDLYVKKLGRGVQDTEMQSETASRITASWGEEDYEVNIYLSIQDGSILVSVMHEYKFEGSKKAKNKIFNCVNTNLPEGVNLYESDSEDYDNFMLYFFTVGDDESLDICIPKTIDDAFIEKMDSKILELSNELWRKAFEVIKECVDNSGKKD